MILKAMAVLLAFLLSQNPTLEQVLVKMKERAVKSGVARATIVPEVDPFSRGGYRWPNFVMITSRSHSAWDFETLDDGACFIGHEDLVLTSLGMVGPSGEAARLTASWTLLRGRSVRSIVYNGKGWATYAFTPDQEFPDRLTDPARLVLYSIQPEFLRILEPGLRVAHATEDEIQLVAGLRTFTLDRTDFVLKQIETKRQLGGMYFWRSFHIDSSAVTQWSERKGVRLPSRVPGAADVRYSNRRGDSKKADGLFPAQIIWLDYPLGSPESYRQRLAKIPSDTAAAYGLFEATRDEFNRKLSDRALSSDHEGLRKLRAERKKARRRLSERSGEVIGALLGTTPVDSDRIARGSLALRFAHGYSSSWDKLVLIPEAQLPSSLRETRSDLLAAVNGDPRAKWVNPAAAYLLRLRLLAGGHGAPKRLPKTLPARLLFGNPTSRLRAALSAREEQILPYAVSATWRVLLELRSSEEIDPRLRAEFEKWVEQLPSGVAKALEWRLAVIDDEDHANAASRFLETLGDWTNWPLYARRLSLEAAAHIIKDYRIGHPSSKADLNVLPVADLLLEAGSDQTASRLIGSIASDVARALTANPEAYELILQLEAQGFAHSPAHDKSSDERYVQWAIERLKKRGTRDELVGFARRLANKRSRSQAWQRALREVHEILFSRFANDSDVAEAAAVALISDSPLKALEAFEKSLQSKREGRHGWAMIGIAECVRQNPDLRRRATSILSRNSKATGGLGPLGWIVIAQAFRAGGDDRSALNWAREGLKRLLKAKIPGIRHKWTLHAMLGQFLERAGFLEDAMRQYRMAAEFRVDEGSATAQSFSTPLSSLVGHQISANFPNDDPAALQAKLFETHGRDIFVRRLLAGHLPPLIDKKAAQEAFSKLASEDSSERDAGTQALRKVGIAALRILEKGFDAPDPEVRARARALARELAEPR